MNDNDKKVKEIKYYAITEQGDLGLGADILCEQDQEIMKKEFDND